MRKIYFKQYLLICAFLMISGISFAQTGIITGKVVDETNQPLPGAIVSVVGAQKNSPTDANGNFKLTGVANGTVTLQANFIGYKLNEKTITVTGNTTVNFNMAPSSTDLNEVVVIGYGTVQKKDLTGSVATITAKDFNQGAVTAPEQLIQGKVAGVSIISNSGAPGAASQILIRGGASVNGSNAPLIVVDGIPLDDAMNPDGTSKISGVANPLAMINPNDIESFSILKDASAAAIYGNRASSGVILITTKKGQAGAPKINFSTQLSVSTLPKEAPVLSASQFRSFVKQYGDTAQIAQLGTANTDWQKQIYQTAISTDDNVSISGTSGHLPYRVSVGYTDQNGIMKTTSLQRYSTGINLSPSFFTDHLKLNFNFNGSQVKQRFANEGAAVGDATSFNPTYPVYSGNANYGGYYEYLQGGNLSALTPRNPLGVLEEENNSSTAYRMITSLNVDYKLHFFPDLHINVNLGYDGSTGSGTDVIPSYAASQYPGTTVNGVNERGVNSRYKGTNGNKTLETYLSYSKTFKSIKSHVDAVVGYSDQEFTSTGYAYQSRFGDMTLNPNSIPAFPITINQYDLTSVYGRLNYGYDDRFLITGTVREDNSTRFAPNLRTGYFPSGALAWVISHEDFLKNNTVLSNLKLRIEYGITGNQSGIGDYEYLSDYSISNNAGRYLLGNQYTYMYRPGAYYPGRTWEQTATTNVGFDYGFLGERITGSIDYYFKKTDHLLATIGQPAGTNFGNSIIGNVGNMQTNGLEFNISGKIIDTKDQTWTANFNVTFNKNKITNLTAITTPEFPGDQVTAINGGTGNTVQINQVGYPRNSFFVYQQVYGANGKPLDGVFVDRNGDGTINNSDLYIDHSPDPKEYFGFSSDYRYKKWGIGFVTRASLGNYAYNNVASSTGISRNILNPLGFLNNGSSDILNTLSTGNGNNDLLSDYYIQNASFLKMDNAHISYNFGKVFKNTGDLRLSGNVNNVFTITQYKGVDPEITNGVDNNLYPRPRTFVLGVNLSL
jgi:TonB-linked SusC/RagA family outer membrane protein